MYIGSIASNVQVCLVYMQDVRGLPPVTQPNAQCWFQIIESREDSPDSTLVEYCNIHLDSTVMCYRRQLAEEPPANFRLFYSETMTNRSCANCTKVQFKNMGTTLGGKPRYKLCAGCCKVHYCDAVCQTSDWFRHRDVCRVAQRARWADMRH